MIEKPLLIFPKPIALPREKKEPRFGSDSYHYPTFQEQKDRLTPQIEVPERRLKCIDNLPQKTKFV